jgi:hypothetical protein
MGAARYDPEVRAPAVRGVTPMGDTAPKPGRYLSIIHCGPLMRVLLVGAAPPLVNLSIIF